MPKQLSTAAICDKYFSLFWRIVPARRKVGKRPSKAAFSKAIVRLVKEGKTREQAAQAILEGMERYAACWPDARDRQFCLQPQTWLNQSRWDDDPESAVESLKAWKKEQPMTYEPPGQFKPNTEKTVRDEFKDNPDSFVSYKEIRARARKEQIPDGDAWKLILKERGE
jgi:hypothetical protein